MTFNAKSMLGGSLLGQKNYIEAEPLLLAPTGKANGTTSTTPSASQAWARAKTSISLRRASTMQSGR